MVKIGVVADTHVKDRVIGLHPQVLSVFKDQGVSMILHAGDVSTTAVISELSRLAPVLVVQGNTDVMLGCHFPMEVDIEVDGVRIGMAHGQGSFLGYLKDRIGSVLFGPRMFRYFEERVQRLIPLEADIDVLVFGHIHTVVNRWQNGKLLFNPGSASIPIYQDRFPTVGILTIDAGMVSGTIIPLEKVQMKDLTLAMRRSVFMRGWLGRKIPGLQVEKEV